MNKKKNKNYNRVNDKNNFYNFFPRIYFKIVNFFKYKSIYFLDTSNIIADKNRKKIGFIFYIPFINFFITEKVNNEIIEKIKQGHKVININKIKIIKFDLIREELPDVCPLYYNYISNMYNPAVLDSPLFVLEMLLSEKAKGKKLSEENEKIYNKIFSMINNGRSKEINIFGEKGSNYEKYIDESFYRLIKKKKNSIKKPHHNQQNDCKNLSLALIYCLLKRKNLIYISSDIDNIAYLFNWIEGVAQQSVFKQIILSRFHKLPDHDKKRWSEGKPISIFVNYEDEFKKLFNGYMTDMLSHDWKKTAFHFILKYWDQKEKKFIKYKFSFNNLSRELLLTLHGNCSCPYVKNYDYGNWIKYLYWPLLPHNKYFKILLLKKRIIKVSSSPNWILHSANCNNRNLDPLSVYDFRGYSQFT